jgi:hypothetical protein
MAESEANINNQSLVTTNQTNGEDRSTTTDFRGQAQQYGQQAVDALNRAKGYAQEYGQQAVDKFKDLQGLKSNRRRRERFRPPQTRSGNSHFRCGRSGFRIAFTPPINQLKIKS